MAYWHPSPGLRRMPERGGEARRQPLRDRPDPSEAPAVTTSAEPGKPVEESLELVHNSSFLCGVMSARCEARDRRQDRRDRDPSGRDLAISEGVINEVRRSTASPDACPRARDRMRRGRSRVRRRASGLSDRGDRSEGAGWGHLRVCSVGGVRRPRPLRRRPGESGSHHIPDLAGALAKVARLLRPRGRLIVHEHAWERMDEPTARWYLEQPREDRSRRPTLRRELPRRLERRSRRPAWIRGDAG